jgi:hypothetical protein
MLMFALLREVIYNKKSPVYTLLKLGFTTTLKNALL